MSHRTVELLAPPEMTEPNSAGAFLNYLKSPWAGLVSRLHHHTSAATLRFAEYQGIQQMHLPLTTRTVTCPSAFGSDASPVPVTVSGVSTYLSDSMQFALEYGCRISPLGCYTIAPSFRGDAPDRRHLSQFVHSEFEIPGDLDRLMTFVGEYVQFLSAYILEKMGDELLATRGSTAHLETLADKTFAIPRLPFEEAIELLAGNPSAVRTEDGWCALTNQGEQALMEHFGGFVWVYEFDELSVPFYQANGRRANSAAAADLLFGLGEIVGSGQRHQDVGTLRESMKRHEVREGDYAWYLRMRQEMPLQTSGFGMGLERFMLWVLKHDDIRDVPLISRIDESATWPDVVERP